MNHSQPNPLPRLFRAFPGLQGNIPWAALNQVPSPLERMEAFSRLVGADVWVKRDDLSNAQYGGNKPRKLEFLLADARARHKKTVITMGAIGTNHGLATTILGGRMGFKVALILFPQPKSDHVKKILLLYQRFGAEMILCPTMRRAGLRYFLTERLRRPGGYFIPAGGSNPLGALGYVDAGLELAEQIKMGVMDTPRAVFAAAGTCGTVAGLALGLRLGGVDAPVVAVQVTPPQVANQATALRLAARSLALLRSADPSIPAVTLTDRHLVMDTDHYGAGYGHATAEGLAAMEMMAASEGLPLEQTYTAKTLAALVDFARGHLDAGPLLFLDTFSSVDLTPMTRGLSAQDLAPEFRVYFD